MYSAEGANQGVLKPESRPLIVSPGTKDAGLISTWELMHDPAGADPGGGSWGSGPPPFGGPPNFIKKEKWRAHARENSAF